MSPPSSSPRPIQVDPTLPSPSHRRSMSGSGGQSGQATARSPARALGGSQHRGSAGSSYRGNVDVQRQMQQDIDSAMSMSRARSSSLVERSPMLRGQRAGPTFTSSPIEESPFGMLSEAEEREMDRARRHADHEGSDDGHMTYRHDEGHLSDTGSSRTYESHTRRRSSTGDTSEQRRQMGLAHPDGSSGIHSSFDFRPMEEFAAHERDELDELEGPPEVEAGEGGEVIRSNAVVRIASPSHSGEDISGSGSSTRKDASDELRPQKDPFDGVNIEGMVPLPPDAIKDIEEESHPTAQTNFHRRRARKSRNQNQSNPAGRQAKLALFESFGGTGGDTPGGVGALKAPRAGKQHLTQPDTAFQAYTDAPPGHERPYRFSFYSNALPVTIHARSLAELPAEGQTFEDLFKGRPSGEASETAPTGATPTQSGDYGSPRPGSGLGTTPNEPGLLSKALTSGGLPITSSASTLPGAPGGPPPSGKPTAEEDPEAYTWWLDVLSPTDEEMRMLSSVFGIHPLTTEDILLEETREKIELFRNYYLVCFRSFDQDPYSQTYLEPLNMYIIVFREGTLSFHFRGTPHPQNVRRRIKHLKDYISVTSDWISYALIDDITDAFGPLIQSIEYEVDSIDELVLILKEAEQTDMLRRIGTCRKKVMGLLRLMGSKADVVKGLAKRCNENWLVAPKSDIGLYLSDIQDHLITMTSNLNHYEKILSRSHSNYLAQISIEMTDANNQINDVLSKLTALGTVLIPMNLVTGLWGMNVHVPGEDTKDGYSWFGGILGCLAAFAVLGAWATYKCFVR